MKTKNPDAARQPESGSATPGISTADHMAGGYPGGPSSGHTGGARHHPTVIRGISDVEALRERLPVRRRHRRRVRHAIEVLILGVALAVVAGVYVGFEAHESPERATETMLQRTDETDISKEAKRLLNELWKMEDMERLPRR